MNEFALVAGPVITAVLGGLAVWFRVGMKSQIQATEAFKQLADAERGRAELAIQREHNARDFADVIRGERDECHRKLAEATIRIATVGNHLFDSVTEDDLRPDEPVPVLVIDDNAIERTAIYEVLSGVGYDVWSAASADEARRLLDGSNSPRIVLLDWMLPGTDGLAFVRELRMRENGKRYIIMVTSKTSKRDQGRAITVGVDDYVTKPFDRRVLLSKLATATSIVCTR